MKTEFPPERGLLLHLVAEVVEKLMRFGRLLDRQEAVAPREYKKVVELFRTVLRDLERGVTDNMSLIKSVLFQSTPQEFEKHALLGILQNSIKSLYGLHERLVLLPREGIDHNILTCFSDLFKKEWDDAEPSIILTTIYNAYEYCYLDVIRNVEALEEKLPDLSKSLSFIPGSTSILELPIIDRDNPLSWPFLAHEFGHGLDRKNGITGTLSRRLKDIDTSSKQRQVLENWISEILADFIAGRVLGPAAMLPLFSLEVGLSPIIEASTLTATHPPTPFRVEYLKKYLNAEGMSFDPFEVLVRNYESIQHFKIAQMPDKDKSSHQAGDALLHYIFQQLEKPLIDSVAQLQIGHFEKESLDRAATLTSRLAQGIPISSNRHHSDESLRDEMKLMLSRSHNVQDVQLLLSKFEETPTSSAEILCAGWLYKLQTFECKLQAVFSSDKADFAEYGEYLAKVDDLLLKSLQLSAVHSRLVSRDAGLRKE